MLRAAWGIARLPDSLRHCAACSQKIVNRSGQPLPSESPLHPSLHPPLRCWGELLAGGLFGGRQGSSVGRTELLPGGMGCSGTARGSPSSPCHLLAQAALLQPLSGLHIPSSPRPAATVRKAATNQVKDLHREHKHVGTDSPAPGHLHHSHEHQLRRGEEKVVETELP